MNFCCLDRLRIICLMLIGAGLVSGNASGVMIATEASLNGYPRKKEIPSFTLADLTPPYLEHTYFDGHEVHPFQAQAVTFNLVNAWWMAEASTLAYADAAFAAEWLKKAGFDEIRFLDKHSTQCFVASNRELAVVAFRGSEVWSRKGGIDARVIVADFVTNADFRLTDWANGSRVHRGFKKALDEVWEDLAPLLASLRRRGCRIWMTGHSLGAALATLAADRFGEVQGVYTFGSPRVGNRQFKENCAVRIYRFVNGDDLVSRVPPAGLYEHVGEPKFIDQEGRIRGYVIKDTRGLADSAAEGGQPTPLEASQPPRTPWLVPNAVIDHVPLLYAVMIWNNLVDARPGAE